MSIPTSGLMRFLPAAAFAALAIVLGFALRNDPRKMPSMLIDRAPPRFSLPPLEPSQTPFKATDLDGKLALINVFASWCPQCRVEHPTLMRLSETKTVPLYGINWKDKPGKGLEWLNVHRNPYLKVGDDADGRVGIDMGVTGVPETFVIDTSGRIRYRHEGPITEQVWQETFEPLLASLRNGR